MDTRTLVTATHAPLIATLSSVAGILISAGCFSPDERPTLVPAPPFAMGSEITLTGTILENVSEGAQLGKSVYLKIQLPQGHEAKVIYGAGSLPCLNQAAEASGMAREAGDEAEVYGIAVSNDTVSTCPSRAYYIRQSETADFTQRHPHQAVVP